MLYLIFILTVLELYQVLKLQVQVQVQVQVMGFVASTGHLCNYTQCLLTD